MSAHVAREVALIVNPSAGGGRAARALPAVEARLRALGVALRGRRHAATSATRASSPSARRSAARVVVTLSGDGMLGAVAGALREVPGAVVGVLPGGRGNDFARVVGIPLGRRGGVRRRSPTARRAPIDLGPGRRARPSSGSRRCGFDSEANRIANERARAPGPARLPLRRAARAGDAGSRPTFTVEVDGERRQLHRLERRRRQLEGLRRRDVRRPRRRARRRRPRRRHTASARARRTFLRKRAAQGLQGRARPRAERRTCCAAPRCASTPTARSWSTPTATRSASCR